MIADQGIPDQCHQWWSVVRCWFSIRA